MQPLVQSAIDAANRGENNKALELCKQALAANPNDVDAWLVVAAVVEQPERKRQCLNRVLTIDPTNQIARDELLDMDRAAMGVPPTQPTAASTFVQSPPPVVPSPFPSPEIPRVPANPQSMPTDLPSLGTESPAKTPAQTSPDIRLAKPLSFSYSSCGLWSLYITGGLGLVAGCLAIIAQDVNSSIRFLIPALFMIGFALSVSSKTVVSETGIRTSNLLSGTEIKWKDIASIQSGNKNLKVISKKRESLKIPIQIRDYPLIIEILQQKRPDLFGADIPSPTRANPSVPGNEQPQTTSATAFTSTKTFQKSFFSQYGWGFSGILFCMLLIFIIVYAEVHWDLITIAVILLSAAFGALLIIFPFFSISTIKVKSDRLILSTFFGEHKVDVQEIQDIRMRTVQNRLGVRNLVDIFVAGEKQFTFTGFPPGEEIIYGFLTNWWNVYRTR